MSSDTVKVGILFSLTGSYAAIGAAMRAGAELAIAELNTRPNSELRLDAVFADPQGNPAAYADVARGLLTDKGLTHVIGCYTSSSRKEVLPVFEKHDALLWYPSHYEGFESSENVIYTGAAPNQHVLPLAAYLLRTHGGRGWFVGSNYVWAWENNRILREAILAGGGTVLGERYFPVGDIDLEDVVRQIVRDRPDFIFTTLIGESCYQFCRLLRAEADRMGIDQAAEMPIASCSLSEAELPHLGAAADGHLSSSVYFSTIETAENARFSALWRQKYAHLGNPSADAEATYIAVRLLARAIERAGDTGFHAVREAVRGLQLDAPQGPVTVDADNLHCAMRPQIGRSRLDGTFDVVFAAQTAVAPDPYLVWSGAEDPVAHTSPGHLRVVR
ncbi:transporter substrate-binding domain-containing protein [Aestuariivita sp.]|jgi:branched-chain amino acid transport system substrate-binding protein|uniref:transporter substrate-binding domain-containing protein n=1 Tax=Aestuariivita sp. TaxID=1872407 RepID=UPI00216EAA5B|nr:transporter substrate-binding domain-containing protein [Aestuariivita sp.]MCE8009089.1 transporter substrate-binding domain-containing protein [Aestuariivita sp.]